MPAAFQPVYCATKHGVIGFTRSIAVSMHFPKGCQQLLGNMLTFFMLLLYSHTTGTEFMKENKVCEAESEDGISMASVCF